jgi:hypothetical protein
MEIKKIEKETEERVRKAERKKGKGVEEKRKGETGTEN